MSSCTEEINIKLNPNQIRLVVEGGISFDTISHTIILSTTMPYFSSNDDIPYVSGASVTITEFYETVKTRVFVLNENPNKKGHYETDPDVFGKQRHTYRLDISNVNIGGQTHYSADAYFPPIADRIDSIRAIWGENLLMLIFTNRPPDTTNHRTGWNVEVFAKDPPGNNYYAFIVYRNDTAINDTLTRFMLLDNEMISQTVALQGLPLAYISDSSRIPMREGDKIT
ncbi:MAG: DUF4249 domain-containing protein, partial [Bacteroidales bacterium]|nr:DUF4249 domain-containing protein [Bacteroidales bacterium]